MGNDLQLYRDHWHMYTYWIKSSIIINRKVMGMAENLSDIEEADARNRKSVLERLLKDVEVVEPIGTIDENCPVPLIYG